MSALIVSKFGGTSMGTPAAMTQAAKIIASKDDVRMVVVSATSGTTNQLIRIDQLFRNEEKAYFTEVEALKSRHLEMAAALECDASQVEALHALFAELESLLPELKDLRSKEHEKKLDQLLSLGERLSSVLFTQALRKEGKKASLIDARLYLRTDSTFGRAEADKVSTADLCDSLIERLEKTSGDDAEILVTQGFIGSDEKGNTTTLGRGGSDYSAALFAEALEATLCEIWTDVPGILTMDPRIVPSARVIPEISFAEAAEMANFGAKVLHPATLLPAVRSRIPVFVGSTFTPNEHGTRILANDQITSPPLIRAIAQRKKQVLITVSSLRMLNAQGFLAKMFDVLARHQLSVDLVTTSEVSVALTIDETSLGSSGKSVLQNHEMLDELRQFADVTVEEHLTLIAIIGNRINQSSGLAAKIFHSISEVNMRLICHGASEHNVCFLVSSEQATEVVKRLHHVCIEWSSS